MLYMAVIENVKLYDINAVVPTAKKTYKWLLKTSGGIQVTSDITVSIATF